ncbi:hypothetical protein [Sinanaerobacter chloroacetimidivorans]|jgi:hypothetical protein|uniref:Flavodoxin domain-containing protein n=1 Tax=Sinanaerobacter chloroacetimidivorans TaxID=2818044 RepID=A0A8J8B1Y1_9FIRM|nr:hypothetical protein [Sinanaerobacter chloroacetimidivorans]MBR0598719.1 hypothetical protein [Sinanaerobacter chloroacetimidivorans]
MDSILRSDEKIQIVYFTGAGGSVRVASAFACSFSQKGYEVFILPLDQQSCEYQEKPTIEHTVGLLVLISPFHAFDAPSTMCSWISGLKGNKEIPTAVITVSVAGQIWLNTAGRANCIKTLEEKGCITFYERMLLMPASIFTPGKAESAAKLLQVLPLKAEHSVAEILGGNVRRPGKTKLFFLGIKKYLKNINV